MEMYGGAKCIDVDSGRITDLEKHNACSWRKTPKWDGTDKKGHSSYTISAEQYRVELPDWNSCDDLLIKHNVLTPQGTDYFKCLKRCRADANNDDFSTGSLGAYTIERMKWESLIEKKTKVNWWWISSDK